MIVLIGGILVGLVLFFLSGWGHSTGAAVLLGFIWYAGSVYALHYSPPIFRLAQYMGLPLFVLPLVAFILGYAVGYEKTETFRIRVGFD